MCLGYLISDLGSKQPACPSRADGPGVHVLRVGPHQVTERPLVWDLLIALYSPNLIKGLDIWGKPSMHTQDLFINQLQTKTKDR